MLNIRNLFKQFNRNSWKWIAKQINENKSEQSNKDTQKVIIQSGILGILLVFLPGLRHYRFELLFITNERFWRAFVAEMMQ